MAEPQIIQAELTWTGEAFERDVQIGIDGDGMISHVGRELGRATSILPRRALLPGFVNAHSHAFQRGLRGRGEQFPESAGSFWTWREAMYELVEQMDADRIYSVSRQAFAEMRSVGITTVGEFHYLHHSSNQPNFDLDGVVLRAAADVGIRIVLLVACYQTGGFDQPLQGGQMRFATLDVDAFWRHVDRLETSIESPLQSIGIVAHSIRAVPVEQLKQLAAETTNRGYVLHMHLEEQRQEIAGCLDHYGKTPMTTVLDAIEVNERFTAVHCTHTAEDDMARFCAAGGNICICPLTEANLGDGIANVPHMLAQGANICLGSDSNARISMLEEMRWLEYVQRLAREQRGIVRDAGGDVARPLLEIATANGARSLGLKVGRIEPGRPADLTVIDLEHPALHGCDDDNLLVGLIFGATDDVIAGTGVGGNWQPVLEHS